MEWTDKAACRGKNSEWTVQKGRRGETEAALQACHHCAALADCREYASAFPWFGVIVGAWVAPSKGPPRFPPWAHGTKTVGSGQEDDPDGSS